MESLSDIAPIKLDVLSPFYDDDHKIPHVDIPYKGPRYDKYVMRVSVTNMERPNSNYKYINDLPSWVFPKTSESPYYLHDELKIRGIKFKDRYYHDVDDSSLHRSYACSLYMMQLHDSRYYQFRINFPDSSYRTHWKRMN